MQALSPQLALTRSNIFIGSRPPQQPELLGMYTENHLYSLHASLLFSYFPGVWNQLQGKSILGLYKVYGMLSGETIGEEEDDQDGMGRNKQRKMEE